jgi:hypothetical protein
MILPGSQWNLFAKWRMDAIKGQRLASPITSDGLCCISIRSRARPMRNRYRAV